MFGLFNREKTDYKAVVDGGAKVIDVRTAQEYNSGHVKGSVNWPLDQIESWSKKLKSGEEVVLVCRSGARAGQAQSYLERSNITAHNAGAWQNLM